MTIQRRLKVTVQTETVYWYPYSSERDSEEDDPRYESLTLDDLCAWAEAYHGVEVISSGEGATSSWQALRGASSTGHYTDEFREFERGIILTPEDARRHKSQYFSLPLEPPEPG